MAVAEIVKAKNLIIFVYENGKQVELDINDCAEKIEKWGGKPFPKGSKRYIETHSRNISERCGKVLAKEFLYCTYPTCIITEARLQFLEKIQNAGIEFNLTDRFIKFLLSVYNNDENRVIRLLARHYHENMARNDFQKEVMQEVVFGYVPCNDDLIYAVTSHLLYNGDKPVPDIRKIRQCAFVAQRLINQKIHYALSAASSGYISINPLYTMVEKVYDACQKMAIPFDVPSNAMRYFGEVMNAYSEWEKANSSRLMQKAQENAKLEFEDDNFIIAAPLTAQELVAEGLAQNNCVGTNHYDKKIIEGQCNIAFMRKKENPQQSYITVEISSKGEIRQAPCKNNTPIRDLEALRFLDKYRQYLLNRGQV